MRKRIHSRWGIYLVFAVAAGQWGALASWPVLFPGDITGDGRDDLVLYSSESQDWTVYSLDFNSSPPAVRWGEYDAVPVVGRFFDSSRSSIGFYHPPSSRWMLMRDYGDKETVSEITLGEPDSIPVIGDFDGDGLDDLGLYDPVSGAWSAWRTDGQLLFRDVSWGYPGVRPFAADVNGDGFAELCVYDPARGEWHIRGALSPLIPRRIVNWGYGNSTVFVGDFDGSRQADLAVWDRHENKWYVRNALTGKTVLAGRAFGDLYGAPAPARYEDGRKINLSYISMGHGIWHVQTHAGGVITPNLPGVAVE